jgi:hypothetical protein
MIPFVPPLLVSPTLTLFGDLKRRRGAVDTRGTLYFQSATRWRLPIETFKTSFGASHVLVEVEMAAQN